MYLHSRTVIFNNCSLIKSTSYSRVFISSQYDNVSLQITSGQPTSAGHPGCQLIESTLWVTFVIYSLVKIIAPINPSLYD